MQKLKLAITVGKKILAAKDAHDTKKAMETHSYLSAVENQEGAVPVSTAHVIALTHLANAELHSTFTNTLPTHSIWLKVCKPGTEEVRAFLEIHQRFPNTLVMRRVGAIPLSLAGIETLQYQLAKMHLRIAEVVGGIADDEKQ